MNTPRHLPPTPPARGSFPLDHGGQCKAMMQKFLICMKQHGNTHADCRELSKEYLQCRMDKGLMSEEDLNTLGFSPEAKVVPAPEKDEGSEEIIAGLSAAKKKQGIMFGIKLDGSMGERKGGHG